MKTSGIAETTLDIIDLSILIATGLKGIVGVLGHTERGPINKPMLIGSWPDFTREFGGLIAEDDFPLYCKRALEAGAKLMVCRVGHYTSIADKTTLVGVKAALVLAANGVAATFTAKSIGPWANNKLRVVSTPAANGVAAEFDITVSLDGYPDFTETVKNVPAAPTAANLAQYNSKLKLVDITAATTIAAFASAPLVGGAQVYSAIVDLDYIGSESSGTGIRAFDQVTDITKIAIPARAINAIDIALANYAVMRGDLIAILRTPMGLDGATQVDYREAAGVYSAGAKVDTFRAFMICGGDLRILHPETGLEVLIHPIADVLGCMSRKDNKSSEWFSFSGSARGRISNTLGLTYNLGSAAKKTIADLVDSRGLIPVIEHDRFGVVCWGNSTLQKADTLLKHANVAELMIFMTRSIKPLVEMSTFEPNDIQTWRAIYRRVQPFLEILKTGRAIHKYLYQGDQDINDVSEAVVNTPQNIDAGTYVFNLWIAPIVALKYIGIRVAVTNSNVSFSEIAEQNPL